MKLSRYVAIISVALLCTVGTFSSPLKVTAQSIDRQTESGTTINRNKTLGLASSLLASGQAVFDEIIARQQNQEKDAAIIKSYGGVNTQAYKNYLAANKLLLEDVADLKNQFTSTFQGKISSDSTDNDLYVAYSTTLIQTDMRLAEFKNSIHPVIVTNAHTNAATQILSSKIKEQSNTRRDELKATGNTTEASQLNNAIGEVRKTEESQDAIQKSGGCTSWVNWELSACIDNGIAWFIKHTLLRFAGYLLWITATIFNYAIQIGILEFARWAPETLYPIWIIIRQILSLLIVFAGLYLGFMYILGKSEIFEKYIPWVIVFALFVNFSYPITRAMIDVSNIVSLKIYVAAVGEGALTGGAAGADTAGAKIRDSLGLAFLISKVEGTEKGVEPKNVAELSSTPSAILAVIMVLYAAYIFFLAAAIMVGRTASLVFITIASPLLLVDSVFPKLDEAAAKLRGIFLSQLIVAPVFMIMLALTLKFIDVFKLGGALASKPNDAISMFFNLTMMLIMLHIMIKVTKHVSGEVGKFMTGAAGKIGGLGLGLASGGVGFAARATIGRAAAAARDSKWVSNNRDGFLGRRAYSMSSSLAQGNYDIRNNSFVSGKMDKIGMGMGMGSKTNYEQAQEKIRQRREEGLETAGRHTRNVYSADGQLLHRKGDLDTSEEGMSARARYIDSAGGLNSGVRSLFTSRQTMLDTKLQLEEANKKLAGSQKDKLVAEYLAFEDTDEGRKKKKLFFDRQKDEDREKLSAADKKKIVADYTAMEDTEEGRAAKKAYLNRIDGNTGQKVLNDETIAKLLELDRKKALSEYKSFEDTKQGRKEKEEFYNRQDQETKERIDEYNETIQDKKEEQERKEREVLETNRRIAEAQEQLVALLGGQKGGNGLVPPPPQSGASPQPSGPTPLTPSSGGAAAGTVTPPNQPRTEPFQSSQSRWVGQGNTNVPAVNRQAKQQQAPLANNPQTTQQTNTPQRPSTLLQTTPSATTPKTPEQIRIEKQQAAARAIQGGNTTPSTNHKEYDEEITF
jgi:hypothetical protein